MAKIQNPFVVKGRIPAEYFCDRVEETAKLEKLIGNGNDVVLIAPRRVGKTGLIMHLFDQPSIRDNYLTFFIDILQTTSLREFTYALGKQIFDTLKPMGRKALDAFMQTLRSVNAELGYDAVSGLPAFNFSLGSIDDPEYTLEEIFRYIESAEKPCIIAIDEFQQIMKYPEKNVEAVLRTHIQKLSNCNFIFAGSERHILAEMFTSYSRPFYNSTSTVNLDELSKEVYLPFVKRLFSEGNKEITDENIEKVYNLFEGNTFCMQKTFNNAFANLNNGEVCTYDVLAESISDIIGDRERDFQNRLSLLSSKPKELLLAIAKDRKAEQLTSGRFVKSHRLSSASSVQSALKQLLTDDWVSCTPDKKYYIADQFFALWLQQHYGMGFTL